MEPHSQDTKTGYEPANFMDQSPAELTQQATYVKQALKPSILERIFGVRRQKQQVK